jgi:hypothetical protein
LRRTHGCLEQWAPWAPRGTEGWSRSMRLRVRRTVVRAPSQYPVRKPFQVLHVRGDVILGNHGLHIAFRGSGCVSPLLLCSAHGTPWHASGMPSTRKRPELSTQAQTPACGALHRAVCAGSTRATPGRPPCQHVTPRALRSGGFCHQATTMSFVCVVQGTQGKISWSSCCRRHCACGHGLSTSRDCGQPAVRGAAARRLLRRYARKSDCLTARKLVKPYSQRLECS